MTLAVPVQVQTTIRERIRETPGLPLSALASDGSGVRANDVYAMLALDLIYTDLYAAPLIQHGRVRLYLNAEQARTYAHLLPTRLTSRVGRPARTLAAGATCMSGGTLGHGSLAVFLRVQYWLYRDFEGLAAARGFGGPR
jgi:hypothetical protein